MDSPAQPWYKRAFTAWMFAASMAGYLFTVTAIPVIALFIGRGIRDFASLSFACFPLALAGLVFALLALLSPSLVAGNRLQFPLNFTLPTVYCSLVFLSTLLMANVRPPIALIGESPRIDQVWDRPDFLVGAWVVQVVCLSLSSLVSNRQAEDPS